MKSSVIKILCLIVFIAGGFSYSSAQELGFKFPEYKKLKLSNGITLYLLENKKVPLITVSALIKAGAIDDGTMNGLSYLTNEALSFGTKSFSKSEIENSFESIGSSLDLRGDLEFSTLRFTVLNSKIESVLPIFKEILTESTFPKEEVEKRKQRLLVELKQQKQRPNAVIGFYFNKFIYSDGEYGNPIMGTAETIEKITETHLRNFYSNHYVPSNLVIAISGDFIPEEMVKKFTELFSGWSNQTSTARTVVNAPELTKSRVLLVNKEDANETIFNIGGIGVPMNNPDYTAIQVVNTVLGGRFTSWLNDELRVNSGLTYGARSSFRSYSKAGLFSISSFTQTKTTFEAIDLALKVLDRLHSEGIDEKTLNSAKNYIKGQFPPRFETNSYLASFLSEMEVYGYDESYVNQFENMVDKLTVEKVKEIISKYFPKDKLQFVLIGKASELREEVKKYGEVTEKEIKDDGF